MDTYLDHNATAPVRPEVREAVLHVLRHEYGNPSAPYAPGRTAGRRLEEARRAVAELLDASPEHIIFTSGGTEANNLAIAGTFFRHASSTKRHLIISAVEHPSVLRICQWLVRRHGAELTIVGVGSDGRVDPAAIQEALRPSTLLVAVMHANNETGVLQPVKSIAEELRGRGVHFHVDGVQTAGRIPVRPAELGCTTFALSAHKFGGLKGTGALVVRDADAPDPLLHGGHQEGGLRAGTENVPGIVAMGVAARLAAELMDATNEHCLRLRHIFDGLTETIPVSWINGHRDERLPNTTNLCCLNADAMTVVLALSCREIHLGTGSACASREQQPSRVLQAMGLSAVAAYSSIRISTGPDITLAQAEAAARHIVETVHQIRLVTAPDNIGTCDENCPCFQE